MPSPVIKVENLSKQYRIGGAKEGYKTFREILVDTAKAPFQKIYSLVNPKSKSKDLKFETIWALKDVSFEVKRGEVVGIIGRNGAGKSTLLKVLSKITEPTEGRVELRGRVGSLLEIGTGFHPELTGHENVYLYGAILGMDRWEVTRKFDEIVAFAELKKFIETPVKRYSSGMYMRLAFAVAAYIETEILLVDEVLAVGDSSFQKKCIGKMDEVAKGGRTVVFVSHQLNQIRRLCSRCILMDLGNMQMYGPTIEVLNAYEAAVYYASENECRDKVLSSALDARFIRWEIIEPRSNKSNHLTSFETCVIRFILQVSKSIRNGHHGIALWDNEGQLMWAWAAQNVQMEIGLHELVYTLPSLPLRPGVYRWQVSIYEDGALLDNWYGIPEFVIAAEPQGHPNDEWSGILNLPCDFKINSLE